MSTVNLFSKVQCDAVIPKGDGYGPIFNACIHDVKLYGFYEYDMGWQWPSLPQIALYCIAISAAIIASIMLMRFLKERRNDA